ncbi:MAG: hexose kinase [Candidatus Eisenbacteria bacterium]|nr:hexose kinase [Candidatus Eisenbacteria bacterium]
MEGAGRRPREQDLITTLTMNPAIDLALRIEQWQPRIKLRAEAPRRFPGGGGINCARVIQRLGGEALALYAAGGPEGARLEEMLAAAGIDGRRVDIEAPTRQSVTLEISAEEESYHIVPPGASLERREWQRCLAALEEQLASGSQYLILSGSLPGGVPAGFYARATEISRREGVPVALDTSGTALEHALHERVDLVKPNRQELSRLGGKPEHPEACARRLIDQGAARIVVITLGAEGVLLATQDDVTRLPVPDVEPVSLLGAGDSLLGACVLALSRGAAPQEACRWGAAAAAATGLTAGTRLFHRHQVERLYRRAELQKTPAHSRASGGSE